MRAELEANQNDRATPATNGIVNDLEAIEQMAALQQRLDSLDIANQRIGELDYVHQRLAHLESQGAQQNTEQLDMIEQRLSTIDGLAAQLQQLNARVAAQAELGGQLSALRDRVGQLIDQPTRNQRSTPRRRTSCGAARPTRRADGVVRHRSPSRARSHRLTRSARHQCRHEARRIDQRARQGHRRAR